MALKYSLNPTKNQPKYPIKERIKFKVRNEHGLLIYFEFSKRNSKRIY